MITGSVNAQREPIVRVALYDSANRAVPFDAIIDTGFNHELTVPPEVVRQLGLRYAAPIQATLAGNVRVYVDCYRATIGWQGRAREVAALELKGAPLVGMELLNGNVLSIEIFPGGSLRVEDAGAVQHFEDRGREALGRNAGQVVVLEQDRVVQAHAMIVSAAAAHGVLVQHAPARKCFAGVVELGGCAGDRVDERPRQRRHAAEVLEEVEQRPLDGEHGSQRPADLGQIGRYGVDPRAVGGRVEPVHGQPLVENAQHRLDEGAAAEDARLLEHQPKGCVGIIVDQRAGDITALAKILAPRDLGQLARGGGQARLSRRGDLGIRRHRRFTSFRPARGGAGSSDAQEKRDFALDLGRFWTRFGPVLARK